MRKFTKQTLRGLVIRASRIFCRCEQPKRRMPNSGLPFISLPMPRNSFVSAAVIGMAARIRTVLLRGTRTQIPPAVVKAVTVPMINRFLFHDDVVHINPVAVAGPYSIASMRMAFSEPVPLREPLKIVGIHNGCSFLCKRDKAVRFVKRLSNRVSFHVAFHWSSLKGPLFSAAIILLSLFAAPAFAQNVRVDNVTFSSVQGFPFLPGATITICTAAGTGLPCSPTVTGTCLSISDTTCNQSATLTSDSLGNYGFWIQPGSYTYTVTKAGFGGFGPKALTLSCQPASTCTITGPQTLTNLTVSGTGTYSGTSKYTGSALFGSGPIFDVTAAPFNADPTGIVDSTTAIQAAITAAAGRYWVHVPAGTYTTSSQLIHNLQSASSFQPGLKLYGDGMYKTFIKPTVALTNSCALYLDGTESGNTFFFQYGAEIRNLTIDGVNSGANACGIKIEGNWFPKLDHVRIANFTGDGILFPSRADIGSNPDAYGTNFARITNCEIFGNGGWGINQQDGPEGDHSIENNSIQRNVLGGVRLNGEESRVIGNSIAFNGYHQASGSQAAGILLDKGPNAIGGGDTVVIEDNEFDSNLMADIMVPRSVGPRIAQNRFLSHYNVVAIDNLVHPLMHLFMNGDVDLVSSFDILANRHLSATRALGNSAFNASITAHMIRGTNVTGGVLDHPFLSGGNSPNLVKYASAGGGLISVTTSGGVIQNTAQVLNPGFYTVAPTITFDATAGSGGVATATLGTYAWYIQVTAPGSGFTSAPSVVFNGGTCTTTPIASAIITPSPNSNSILSEVRLTTFGNCSVAPTSITISGGGGSGATATGFYSTGVVSLNVSNGGSSYPAVVGVVVTPLAGSADAAFNANSNIDLLDRNNSGQDFIGNSLLMMQIKTLGFCNGNVPCTLDRGFTSDGTATTIDVGNGSFRDASGGIKAAHHITSTANPSGTGVIELGNTDKIGWRNAANTADDVIGEIQTQSVSGCTTTGGASAFTGPCTVTVTWPSAFADANYRVSCIGIGPFTAVPLLQGLTGAPIAASVTVQTQQATGVNAAFTTIQCTGIHQ